MIKLITLDLEGVFFDEPKNTYIKELAKYYNKSEAFIEKLLFEDAIKYGKYNEIKLGKINSLVYWNWFFKQIGITGETAKNKANYLETAMSFYSINEQITDLIKKLKKQKIQIGLCSNNYKDKIEYLERSYNLSTYFDIMLFSYDIGYFKTDKEFFVKFLEITKLKPEEIVYSDNKEIQLQVAESLGIKTHLYKDLKRFKAYLNTLNIQT